nr:CHAD domain-containing protein [Pseudomonadota bacterium]
AFRLRQNESVGKGIRRIVGEQIDKAIAELHDPALDRHQAIHQVRKRCKRIRGAIRLVRPQFEAVYRQENACFRDAARTLSPIRDAEAIIATYDALLDAFAGQVDRRTFGGVRRALTLRRKRIIQEQTDLEARLEEFIVTLRQARERVDGWPLPKDGFAAVAGGLKKTYGRGRRALELAYAKPSSARFHEWRKRVKYLRYHLRLLGGLWEPVMKTAWSEVKALSDLLGDDHDLAVFRQTLTDDPKAFGDAKVLQALLGLIDRRRAQLQQQARPLGLRVFAEKPAALARRLDGYWEAWQLESRRPAPALAEAAVPPGQ